MADTSPTTAAALDQPVADDPTPAAGGPGPTVNVAAVSGRGVPNPPGSPTTGSVAHSLTEAFEIVADAVDELAHVPEPNPAPSVITAAVSADYL